MRDVGRVALVDVSPGGLLLNLASGGLFELNETATFIWRRVLSARSLATVSAELALRYDLDVATAALHVNEALRPLTETIAAPATDFRYSRDMDGYIFAFRGEPIFSIASSQAELDLVSATELPKTDICYLLRALAPKLLALSGESVLHASAIEIEGRIVAFCGLSGAGKTTTARAFSQTGAKLISEDQLLISAQGDEIVVTTNGEKSLAAWVARTADELVLNRRARFEDLSSIANGAFVPLTEIGFLDRTRRSRGPYTAKALTSLATSGAVFRNTFYGSDADSDWTRQLEFAANVGRRVLGFDLNLPDDLLRLAEAGRLQVSKKTLK